MAKSAALRQGAATPTVLRDVADHVLKADVDTSTLVFGHIAAERLHLLANELEAQAKAEPASHTLARYQQILASSAIHGGALVLGPNDVKELLAALQHQVSDTTHRLSLAGVAAASAQKEAEHWQRETVAARARASNAELDRSLERLELEQLRGDVAELTKQIEDAETAGEDTSISFVFTTDDAAEGTGVEAAMELLFRLEVARG